MVWQRILWLALAGALGTLARYGLTQGVKRVSESVWGGAGGPVYALSLGTLAVNVVGCFLFGLGWAVVGEGMPTSSPTRLVIFVGFLGAFTTFSTYAFEGSQFLANAQWFAFSLHLVGQNVLGLLAVLVGLALGRWV